MFFLCVFLFLIILISVIKIELVLKKKEKLYIEIKILGIKIISKTIADNNIKKMEKEIIFSPFNTNKINKTKKQVFKLVGILFKLRKRIEFKKAEINVYISDSDYLKGGYYIGAVETIGFMTKNISQNINIHYCYKTQAESLKIMYGIILRFRGFNVGISFIKILIILLNLYKNQIKDMYIKKLIKKEV